MPIKNYSSKVSPAESIGKIQQILAEHDARRIQIEYYAAKPVALTFSMQINELLMNFRLTVEPKGMLEAMKNDPKVPGTHCNEEQAERTAWKNKYEWLHIQLAEVEANQASMKQLLLGYAVTDNGQTLFERLKDRGNFLQEPNMKPS